MRLRDPLPNYSTWIARIIGYGVALVVIVSALNFTSKALLTADYKTCLEKQSVLRGTGFTAMEHAKAIAACVEQENGIIASIAFRPMKELFALLPSVSCQYTGEWLSRRNDSLYKITLHGDGQFIAVPVRTSDNYAKTVTGSWSVVGLADGLMMVWLYDEGQVWPPDINPITASATGGFVLTEKNGSRTEFTRASDKNQPLCDG